MFLANIRPTVKPANLVGILLKQDNEAVCLDNY